MNKQIWIAVIGVLALAAGAAYWYSSKVVVPPEAQVEMSKYESAKYKLSFEYPKSFFIVERETGNGERESHAVVIVPDTQENRDLMSGKIQGTEGPPTITVQMFQNNLDNYTTESWIRGTNDSNFKLSPDGKLTPAGFEGQDALQYRWSGLYEGMTVAAARPDWVYAFSVSYNAPTDQLIKDFAQILTTVKFK